jgi:hypothetical protein
VSSVSPASQHPTLAENSGQHLHHTVPVLFPRQASSRRPPRTCPSVSVLHNLFRLLFLKKTKAGYLGPQGFSLVQRYLQCIVYCCTTGQLLGPACTYFWMPSKERRKKGVASMPFTGIIYNVDIKRSHLKTAKHRKFGADQPLSQLGYFTIMSQPIKVDFFASAISSGKCRGIESLNFFSSFSSLLPPLLPQNQTKLPYTTKSYQSRLDSQA